MFTYSHFDRIIAGGVMPVTKAVELTGSKEMAAQYFLERREMGCINVGGKGAITVDGVAYDLNTYDGLYVGMGAKEISSPAPIRPIPPSSTSIPARRIRPIRP